MAGYVEIQIDQGATFNTTLLIKDSNGNPIDLGDYTYSSQMRKSYYTSNSISFSCDSPNPNTGNLTISLTKEETTNLTPGTYVFDVVLYDTTNVASRLIEGVILVAPGVTK